MCVLGTVCGCENPFKKEKDSEQESQSVNETPASTYVIVRSVECGTDKLNLCYRLNDALAARGMNVSVEKEKNVEFSDDTDKVYILIGYTSAELSKTNEKRVKQKNASFLMEGNCLSICASDDRVLWLAVE
ncbi:MAG: hypothetical protein IKC59_03075, partial [Clostridia bacterium]|nr:hypothetical protein [Clostridia bacterium]